MNDAFNSKKTVRKLDLGGLMQREEQRVRKQQEQAAEYRAGFNSAFAGGHRDIDLQKLKENDPTLYFWLTANRDFRSA